MLAKSNNGVLVIVAVMGSEDEVEKRLKMKKRKYVIDNVVMKTNNKIEPLLGKSWPEIMFAFQCF